MNNAGGGAVFQHPAPPASRSFRERESSLRLKNIFIHSAGEVGFFLPLGIPLGRSLIHDFLSDGNP